MPDLATETTAAVAHDVRIAVTRLTRRLRSVGSARSVTLSQLSALSTLGAHEQMTLGELAAREGVQPPSMTRVVGGLVDAGLVERTAHPTDGRQVLVQLTASGRTLLETEAGAREAWLTTRLDRLAPGELATLRKASDLIARLAAE